MTRGGREIAEDERRFVERLLDLAGPAATPHREQLAGARVLRACSCGCPSFDFAGVPDGEISAPFVDTLATLPDGKDVGVILWARGGRLKGVEVYSFEDLGAFGLPAPDSVRPWEAGPETS